MSRDVPPVRAPWVAPAVPSEELFAQLTRAPRTEAGARGGTPARDEEERPARRGCVEEARPVPPRERPIVPTTPARAAVSPSQPARATLPPVSPAAVTSAAEPIFRAPRTTPSPGTPDAATASNAESAAYRAAPSPAAPPPTTENWPRVADGSARAGRHRATGRRARTLDDAGIRGAPRLDIRCATAELYEAIHRASEAEGMSANRWINERLAQILVDRTS